MSAHGGAQARRPQPTGAGASPAPFREVSPGPGGRRSPGPAAPRALSLSRKLAALPSSPRAPGKAGAGPLRGDAGPEKTPRGAAAGSSPHLSPEKQNKVVFLARAAREELGAGAGRAAAARSEGRGDGAHAVPHGGPRSLGADRRRRPAGNKGPRGRSDPDGGCRLPARTANVRSAHAGPSPKELRPLPPWSWNFQVPRKSNSVPSLLGSWIISPSPKPAPCFSCWTLLFFPV